MASTYFTILTKAGLAKAANCLALGIPFSVSSMGLGDGSGQPVIPNADMTALVHEVYRAPINDLVTDPDSPGLFFAEQFVPSDVGGFTVREMALYDDNGVMIAVGNTPPTPKLDMSSGASSEQQYRFSLLLANGADAVIKIDPSAVIATRKYVNNQINQFKEDLADENSSLLIAGVPVQDLALRTAGDDYTLIQPSAMRISKLTKTLLNNRTSVVITGDSLSFNGFGYHAEMGASGADYATNNPFGLSSWAHILRDAIFTSHESFLPIEKCKLDTSAILSWAGRKADYAKYGINSKVAILTFTAAEQYAYLYTGYSGSKAVIVSYAPEAEAVLFDVNGTAYDNTSPTGHYRGYGYMVIPVAGNKILIGNVRKKADGSAGSLAIYGCGSVNMTIPKLTGKGAWTSGQILNEYDTLVKPYAPDIIYYIIGANDIGLSTPIAVMDNNVRNFIAKARGDKPTCEIILLSTPPCSSYTRDKAKAYIKAMRKIAEDTGSSLIDMWSALEDTPVKEYRFDNIHFTTEGDTLVFDIVRKLTLPTLEVDNRKFHPCRESYIGAYGTFFYYYDSDNLNKPVTITLRCGASPAATAVSPSSRQGIATLSYVQINGKSGLEVTLPSGSVLQSATPLVREFGVYSKHVVLHEVMNERTWRFIGIDNAFAQVDLAGSQLYFILSAMLNASY